MLGALLGNYHVLEKLGEGGMGEVYVGRHATLGHSVAVKVLQAEFSNNDDMVQRFFNEAQAATSIRNLGIVQVFDFGTTPDGRAYFVMELLEGQSLGVRLNNRQLSYVECCRIGRQIANVLQAAHARGIIHRDLKPDNLFLISDPEVSSGERVKVLDFGIAKLAGEIQAAGVKTRTGLVMGTPAYMSPEQCRGTGAVDTRTDIYSLGCLLFRMACGRPPFISDGSGEIVGAHLHLPPPHPASLAPDIPVELAILILKMLEKQPNSRPPTMAAVGQALDEILNHIEKVPVRPSGPVLVQDQSSALELQVSTTSTTLGESVKLPSPRGLRDRRRLAFLLGALLIASGITALAVILTTGSTHSPEGAIAYNDIVDSLQSIDATIVTDTPNPLTPPINNLPPIADATVITDASVISDTARLDASVTITSSIDASITNPTARPNIGTPKATATSKSSADASRAISAEKPATPHSTTQVEIETDCRNYQAAKQWQALDICSKELERFNRSRAQEFKTRAVLEIQSAVQISKVEYFLQSNLKQAKFELGQISSESVEYSKIKQKYESTQKAALANLVTRLSRLKDNCKEYEQLLAQERATFPAEVVEDAQRQVKCQPLSCDPQALLEKARQQVRINDRSDAFRTYQSLIECLPDLAFVQEAFLNACELRLGGRAKTYWKMLTPHQREQSVSACTRNNITRETLNAP